MKAQVEAKSIEAENSPDGESDSVEMEVARLQSFDAGVEAGREERTEALTHCRMCGKSFDELSEIRPALVIYQYGVFLCKEYCRLLFLQDKFGGGQA